MIKNTDVSIEIADVSDIWDPFLPFLLAACVAMLVFVIMAGWSYV